MEKKIKGTNTISEIVADDIRTATVFKKHGLDFCCGGNKTLKDACDENNIGIDDLLESLQNAKLSSESSIDFQKMELDKLLDHIVDRHHKYIYDVGPHTLQFIKKVANVHGENHPETKEVAMIFMNLMSELHHHMMKEEQILFPYIRNLIKMFNGEVDTQNFREFIGNPVRMMLLEHDQAGDMLKKINELTSNFTLPEGACNTFRASYANLKEMEDDIMLHIHLENNVIFPRSIALEKQIAESLIEG